MIVLPVVPDKQTLLAQIDDLSDLISLRTHMRIMHDLERLKDYEDRFPEVKDELVQTEGQNVTCTEDVSNENSEVYDIFCCKTV